MQKNGLHPNTTAMLQAWQRITNTPGTVHEGPSAHEYPDLLGRLFVLQATRPDNIAFRIAGDGLVDILGRNLIGTNFLDLWKNSDAKLLSAYLECVTNGNNPGIIRGISETQTGRHAQVELALAPLTSKNGQHGRLIGLYQTLGGEAMLRESQIRTHYISSMELPKPDLTPTSLKLVASND